MNGCTTMMDVFIKGRFTSLFRYLIAICILLVIFCAFVTIKPPLDRDFLVWTKNSARAKFGPAGNNEALEKSEIALSDTFPAGAIYFLETSGFPRLDPKQLCAIESASLHNSDRGVVVLLASKRLPGTKTLQKLCDRYPNIIFARLDIEHLLKGTVLEAWLRTGSLEKSRYKVAATADVLRYAVVFKHGGIGLDLDIIVLKSLQTLKNATGLEAIGAVNNAAYAFDKGHRLMGTCLAEILERFDSQGWGANGPGLLTRVVQRDWWKNGPLHPGQRGGVQLLGTEAFYPVPWVSWKLLFDNNADTSRKLLQGFNNTYLVHYWNRLSAETAIVPGSNQTLGILAKKHCPITSADHRDGLVAKDVHGR